MLAGDHSVLSSAVFTPKRVENGCMVVTAKIFFEFLLNQTPHTLQKGSNSVIVSTEDGTSCWPSLTACLATHHVLFYELLKFVRTRVRKSKERAPEK